jgi:hypothetical protein
LKTASGEEAETLQSEEQALKFLANATSYGIKLILIITRRSMSPLPVGTGRRHRACCDGFRLTIKIDDIGIR